MNKYEELRQKQDQLNEIDRRRTEQALEVWKKKERQRIIDWQVNHRVLATMKPGGVTIL